MGFKLFTGLFLLVATATAQDSSQLQSVKKIYVDQLGDVTGSSVIRDHIVAELSKSARFESADSADAADAVLSGTTTLETQKTKSSNGKTRTHYHTAARLQLTDKNKNVLWSADQSHNSLNRSLAEKDLAKNVVRDLVNSATPKKH